MRLEFVPGLKSILDHLIANEEATQKAADRVGKNVTKDKLLGSVMAALEKGDLNDGDIGVLIGELRSVADGDSDTLESELADQYSPDAHCLPILMNELARLEELSGLLSQMHLNLAQAATTEEKHALSYNFICTQLQRSRPYLHYFDSELGVELEQLERDNSKLVFAANGLGGEFNEQVAQNVAQCMQNAHNRMKSGLSTRLNAVKQELDAFSASL